MEKALRADSSFLEVLETLRWQVENDPRVQSVVRALRADGFIVSRSFAPRILVKIRAEGDPTRDRAPVARPQGHDSISTLTQQLKDAAYEVISRSHQLDWLEQVINETVQTIRGFNVLATHVESLGYEFVICLDFSGYPQVRDRFSRRGISQDRAATKNEILMNNGEPLTPGDLEFLKALHIRLEPGTPGS